MEMPTGKAEPSSNPAQGMLSPWSQEGQGTVAVEEEEWGVCSPWELCQGERGRAPLLSQGVCQGKANGYKDLSQWSELINQEMSQMEEFIDQQPCPRKAKRQQELCQGQVNGHKDLCQWEALISQEMSHWEDHMERGLCQGKARTHPKGGQQEGERDPELCQGRVNGYRSLSQWEELINQEMSQLEEHIDQQLCQRKAKRQQELCQGQGRGYKELSQWEDLINQEMSQMEDFIDQELCQGKAKRHQETPRAVPRTSQETPGAVPGGGQCIQRSLPTVHQPRGVPVGKTPLPKGCAKDKPAEQAAHPTLPTRARAQHPPARCPPWPPGPSPPARLSSPPAPPGPSPAQLREVQLPREFIQASPSPPTPGEEWCPRAPQRGSGCHPAQPPGNKL
ncbi:protein enabled homolog [Chiroxiphia lanceolata]|uniref:protein enabled homolog n=1 Tax=Chiroxiphia lanceolata TaxID=296741 RepID=UPI0013CEC87A|nr:protein enabled homolog [Chiroxiphia lanceolata]